MMTSMAQAYSTHPPGPQQHLGVAPGHPMAPSHPQQAGGQPGPGISQQIHMGVSGPGAQVTQAGAGMLGVMPPGVGGPAGSTAHAMQHLNPNQAQLYQQQQAQMAFNNPQMHMAQQHLLQQQQQRQALAARQAMMHQYGNGMPMNMPNGMNPQFNTIRAATAPNMRPVTLTPHLQQQQQAAQIGLEQQQAAQQAQQQQQQHQHMIAQQMAMQQATAVQANSNQGQPNQMGPQQMANLQNAQMAAAQQHQAAQHQQQQAAVTAAQQNQAQSGQSQPQAQQPQQQPQPQQPQQQPQSTPHQSVQANALLHTRSRDQIKGNCVLRLLHFGDHLSHFDVTKQRDDLSYWSDFVGQFFSPRGVLRHSVWIVDEKMSKQYEVTFPALARYFYTHFESGIRNMQLITEKAKEKELPNNYHFVECQKSSFIYWFENGSQLVANGQLRAQFDQNQKIELLEFNTTNHEEFVPRIRIMEAARPLHEWIKEWTKVNSQPDGKQSPEMNKKGKTRPMKSPPTAPPEIDIPESRVQLNIGITPSVSQFLELAEVMGQMNPLFQFSQEHSNLAPYEALDQYVAGIAISAPGMNGPNSMQPGQRTPSMSQFPMNQSPSVAHLGLPDSSSIAGSPAQGHMKATSMALQQSQQGTSSGGPSANTSPNATNKRRRPSVKVEGEEAAAAVGQANGVQPKVKPSPRMGKRQKGNPS